MRFSLVLKPHLARLQRIQQLARLLAVDAIRKDVRHHVRAPSAW